MKRKPQKTPKKKRANTRTVFTANMKRLITKRNRHASHPYDDYCGCDECGATFNAVLTASLDRTDHI